MNTTKQIRLIATLAVILALTAGSLAGADEIYSGGVTVDINRDVFGYLWIEDATVNLLENAHIRNNGYYGDVYATSGCVLNIYGGIIDSYLYVTTSYNGMPEAIVTIYGSDFAVNGVPVAEGTTEIFLQDSQLSGVYQSGTTFSHRVDCFWEGDFYLTVKLGWLNSQPDMAVSPQALNFGQIKVGTTAEQTVAISNIGTANLSLQSLDFVQDSNPGFNHIPLSQLPVTIEPEDTVNATVIFSPVMAGEALGVLRISGDDADTPYVDVVLTGVGIIPDIAVEPGTMDFGQINIGSSDIDTLIISNNGDAQLVIESIGWVDGGSTDFAVAAMPEFPLTIEPAASVELEIVYTPASAGAAAATLEIISDDPDQPAVTLPVTAEAMAVISTPCQQIRAMIAYCNQAVKNGTMQGVGHGRSAKRNVMAIQGALKITKTLMRCQRDRCAIEMLEGLDKFTDGQTRPHDLVCGPAVAELNAQIKVLKETLKAELNTHTRGKCR